MFSPSHESFSIEDSPLVAAVNKGEEEEEEEEESEREEEEET